MTEIVRRAFSFFPKVITTYDRAQIINDIIDAANEGRLLSLDEKRSQTLIAGRPGANSPAAMRNTAAARLLNAARASNFRSNIQDFWAGVNWEKSGATQYAADDGNSTKTAMQLAFERAQRAKSQSGTQHSFGASFDELKNRQLDIIQHSNPADDSYHTWIRSVEDTVIRNSPKSNPHLFGFLWKMPNKVSCTRPSFLQKIPADFDNRNRLVLSVCLFVLFTS